MNFNKTSNPKVDFHNHSKCWRIRVRYYARAREKGKNMDAYGYPTEEEAKNDVENFRKSLENNEEWVPYNKRVHVAVDDNDSSKKRKQKKGQEELMHSEHRSLKVLSGPETKKFKARKEYFPNLSREQFKLDLRDHATEGDKNRFMRSLIRHRDKNKYRSLKDYNRKIYLELRKSILNKRIKDYENHKKFLSKHMFFSNDIEKLILLPDSEDESRVRLTEIGKFNTHKKASLVFDILENFQYRDRRELGILASTDESSAIINFREENNTVSIIDKILKSDKTTWAFIKDEYKENSIKTILSWWNDFKTNDFKGFSPDMRGKWIRPHILDDYPKLKMDLELFIDVTKNVTVFSCKEFLNDRLKTMFDEATQFNFKEIYGITVPIGATTAYHWMRHIKCSYERHEKSYCTDRHNHIDNTTYRDGIYYKSMRQYELRLPLWVEIPIAAASASALEYTKISLGLESNDQLPTKIYKNDITGEQCHCTYVHVDYLRDDQYIKYRMESLNKTGAHIIIIKQILLNFKF
jgi:hypothetical protein